jgi:hypothetical protein
VAGGKTEAVSSVPPPLRLAAICCVVGAWAEDPSEVSRFNEAVAGGVGIGRAPICRRAVEPSSLRRAAASAEVSDPETEKAPTDDLLDSPLVRLGGGRTEESTNGSPAELLACLARGTTDAIFPVSPPLRLVTERLKSELAEELAEDPLEESLFNAVVAGGGGTGALPLGFPLDACAPVAVGGLGIGFPLEGCSPVAVGGGMGTFFRIFLIAGFFAVSFAGTGFLTVSFASGFRSSSLISLLGSVSASLCLDLSCMEGFCCSFLPATFCTLLLLLMLFILLLLT